MQKLHFLCILFIVIFSSQMLTAQEFSEEELKIIEEQYYGNIDFYVAVKKKEAGDQEGAIQFFEKSKQFYREKELWGALGRAYSDIMRIHFVSGDISKTTEEGEAGIAALEGHLEGVNTSVNIHHQLTLVHGRIGRIEEAVAFGERAMALLQKYNLADTAYITNIIANDLGFGYGLLGNLEKSDEWFQVCLDILDYHGNCQECLNDRNNLYGNMGTIYRARKNYEKAFELLEKSKQSYAEIHGEYSPSMIVPYTAIAQTYNDYGELDKAAIYFKKLIQIVDNFGENVPQQYIKFKALAQKFLYEIALNKEDLDLALSYLNQAAETNATIKEGGIETDLDFSTVYRLKGDYDTAERYLIEADSFLMANGDSILNYKFAINKVTQLGLYAELYEAKEDWANAKAKRLQIIKDFDTDQSVLDLSFLRNHLALSKLYARTNAIDSALYHAQMALLQTTNTFKNPDFSSSPNFQEFNFGINTYMPLTQKITLLSHKVQHSSTPEEREKWIRLVFENIDLHDQYHTENIKKLNFFLGGKGLKPIQESLNGYKMGIQAAVNYHQNHKEDRGLKKAFYNTQKFKSQQLLLSQLNAEATSYFNLDRDFANHERDLLADIQYYNEQIYQALQTNDDQKADEIKTGPLLRTEEAYQELVREMEKKYPNYYEAKYTFNPETATSLQAVLKPDELLIEYVFLDSAICAFTIAKNQDIQLQLIPIDAKTVGHIDVLKQMLKNSPMTRPTSRKKFIDISYQLYQQFIQPLSSQLAKKKQLIIIGDGMTNYIPFELLISSNDYKPFNQLDYLLRQHTITYHYSSTLFAKARRKSTTSGEGLFAFAPIYEDNLTTEDVAARSLNKTFRAVAENGHFSPLPESEKEVAAISTLFSQKEKTATTIALRQQATETNLKVNLEKPYRFIHIAGHSFADLDNPKFSGIACYKVDTTNITQGEDGILYSGEIYNINTQTDLITLSSCESGYGKLEKTEGLMGLNRAFIYAGTPNVVFSLWKVYDKVSADLMVDFYKNTLTGKNYAQSLRQAKLSILNNEATASPHYWAPYLLIGR